MNLFALCVGIGAFVWWMACVLAVVVIALARRYPHWENELDERVKKVIGDS